MWKRLAPWVCLAVVLGVFLWYLDRWRPGALFGFYHDDTVYFSAAQALAEGRGRILPSLPGPEGAPPRQTKYPPLYPWLLSWIWRWWPSFPSNIAPAVWMTALFACWFLIAAFQLLRGLVGVGDWPALLLVTLCAFQRNTVLLSGAVLSDVPFLALALTAAVAADSAMRPQGRAAPVVATGILAGLSVLTRSFGVAVIAGIAAAAFYRRAFRQAVLFCLVAAPLLVGAFLPHSQFSGVANADGLGWRETWLFYTSYLDFWKLCVPRADVLLAMLAENLRLFLEAPASSCLFPTLGEGNAYFGMLLGVTLSAGILAGVVRQARAQEWKPIHFIFPLYAAVALFWNYGLMDRFLLLFLPLFYAGLWVEAKHLVSMLRENFRPARPLADKVLAGILGLGITSLLVSAAIHYRDGIPPVLPSAMARRAALAEEKRQAYDWIRQNADPGIRFIAYQDVILYFYTGRQAMRPIAFSTEAFYKKDEKVLRRDLAGITDVARHIGARYWVAAEDDFDLETGLPLIERRMAQLKSVLPVVFRSRGNKVQLYDLNCLQQPDRSDCRAARPVLFPASSPL